MCLLAMWLSINVMERLINNKYSMWSRFIVSKYWAVFYMRDGFAFSTFIFSLFSFLFLYIMVSIHIYTYRKLQMYCNDMEGIYSTCFVISGIPQGQHNFHVSRGEKWELYYPFWLYSRLLLTFFPSLHLLEISKWNTTMLTAFLKKIITVFSHLYIAVVKLNLLQYWR